MHTLSKYLGHLQILGNLSCLERLDVSCDMDPASSFPRILSLFFHHLVHLVAHPGPIIKKMLLETQQKSCLYF